MLRDIYTDTCGIHGIKIIGDFFESTLDNIQSENNKGDGLFIDHGTDGGIISNLMIRSPNLGRNQGYGFHAARASSIDISQGSFINNGKGGLLGEHGIRTVDSVNCENTGLVCIDIPTSDYKTRLVGNNASTDGKTAVTTPLQYTYRYNGNPANLMQSDNYITYYGSGPTRRPSGRPSRMCIRQLGIAPCLAHDSEPGPGHCDRLLQAAERDRLLDQRPVAQLGRQGRGAVSRAENKRNAALGQPKGQGVDDFPGEIDVENGEIDIERTGKVKRFDQAGDAGHHLAADLLQHVFNVQRDNRFVLDDEDLQGAGGGTERKRFDNRHRESPPAR
jgi:hypothetical protein